MQSIVKNKKMLIIILIFVSLPIVIPLISSTISFLLENGANIGSKLRYLMEGYKC